MAFLFIDGECLSGGVVIKRIVALSILIYGAWATLPAWAEDSPNWSLAFKAGYFRPAQEGWKTNYGASGDLELAGQLGFKIARQWELGVEGGYFTDSGKALTASGITSVKNQRIQLYPLQVYLLYRLILSEDQLVVPFAGGGYSHIFFRQSLEGKETVKGDRFGYHARMGLQLLLDWLDSSAANTFDLDWGVKNSYLVFEAQYRRVDDFGSDSINLGGWSYLGGLLFEF